MSRKLIIDPGIKVREKIANSLYELACDRVYGVQEIIELTANKFNVTNYLVSQIFWSLVAKHVIGEDVARGWSANKWLER